jgi:hypothetical protein
MSFSAGNSHGLKRRADLGKRTPRWKLRARHRRVLADAGNWRC